jgi:hypothetical protein
MVTILSTEHENLHRQLEAREGDGNNERRENERRMQKSDLGHRTRYNRKIEDFQLFQDRKFKSSSPSRNQIMNRKSEIGNV